MIATANKSSPAKLLRRATHALKTAITVKDAAAAALGAGGMLQEMQETGACDEVISLGSEYKLRCERRAGKLLAEADLNKGGRPSKTGTTEVPVSLEELGVSKNQSSRWQKVAGIGKSVFEAYVAEHRETPHKLTTGAILRLSVSREPKPATFFQSMSKVRRFVERSAQQWPAELSTLSDHLRALADEIDQGKLLMEYAE